MTMATATTLVGSGSIAIPTKRHDGASQTEPQDEDQDAFSRYYSNDVLRMKALLNISEDASADADDDWTWMLLPRSMKPSEVLA